MRNVALVMVLPFVGASILMPSARLQAQSQSSLSLFKGECTTDDEVPAGERALYEKPALRFVETIIGDAPADAYAQLMDGLRTRLSKDEFVLLVNQSVHPFSPFTELHVEHSYRESQSEMANGRVNTVCTATAHGSIAKPEGQVFIGVMPVPLQAHVIVEATTRNSRWSFILWLFPDKPEWRIGSFHILPTTILDRTATDIWTTARNERDAGHEFNAYLLYVAAAQLSFRGPDLGLGIRPQILKELSELKRPPELQGTPPFEWKLSGTTFRVASIGPIGVGGVFDLQIVHQVEQTSDQHELERQNRELITAFKGAHPEYADVFDGLVVRAVTPSGLGFGTVEQKNGAR